MDKKQEKFGAEKIGGTVQMQMCKWNRGNTVGGITDKENIMDDITDKLKKTRIIKIQQSEREKYAYVEKCFKDISGIKEFHYRNKNSNHLDNCYFGCFINKSPFYLFLDTNKKRIVLYDLKNKNSSYILESDYEDVKKALLDKDNKSAGDYIRKNDKKQKRQKNILKVLFALYFVVGLFYCFHIINSELLGLIVLNCTAALGLQDCLNLYLSRFERKESDRWYTGIVMLEILEIIMAIGLIIVFVVCAQNYIESNLSYWVNIFNIVLTIGTILIKFDDQINC